MGVVFAINMSWVQILLEAKLRNNLGYTMCLSPSGITWSGQGAVMLCGREGNRRPGGK